MSRRLSLPSFRLHKASRVAVVTLCGRDHYLGEYDSPESRTRYERVVAEWLAAGRRTRPTPGETLSLKAALATAWLRAERDYRSPNDKPTSQLDRVILATRTALELYAEVPANQFGTQQRSRPCGST